MLGGACRFGDRVVDVFEVDGRVIEDYRPCGGFVITFGGGGGRCSYSKTGISGTVWVNGRVTHWG